MSEPTRAAYVAQVEAAVCALSELERIDIEQCYYEYVPLADAIAFLRHDRMVRRVRAHAEEMIRYAHDHGREYGNDWRWSCVAMWQHIEAANDAYTHPVAAIVYRPREQRITCPHCDGEFVLEASEEA